jgi:hypothetical protein
MGCAPIQFIPDRHEQAITEVGVLGCKREQVPLPYREHIAVLYPAQ